MSAPVGRDTPQRQAATTHRKVESLSKRPAPPTPAAGSMPFCVAEASAVSVSGAASGTRIADFGSGTVFKTNDATIFPSVFHDTGKTPEYGIKVPANYLVEVSTFLWLAGDIADGPHSVGWVIDGAYSVFEFGPSIAEATKSAFSETGLADDNSAPRVLTHVDHLGDNADWVVGTIHSWYNWTTDPLFFAYGIIVKVLGDLPT